MEVVLLVVALSLSCAAGAGWLAWKGRVQARRLRADVAEVAHRLEQRTRELADVMKRDDRHAALRAAEAEERVRLLASLGEAMRRPLTAVLGFSDLLRAGADPLTARQIEGVAQIQGGGRALLALADRLRELSDAHTGPLTLDHQPLDPGLVVRQVCGRLVAQAAAAGVTLRAPAPRSGLAVSLDPLALERIVAELVTNAIRHNRSGGGVFIEMLPVTEGVAIAVHDTGPGIAASALKSLFQPSVRQPVVSTTNRAGLGLAAAHRLAGRMGGALKVDSIEGEGSTFTLTLPLKQATRPQPMPTTAALTGPGAGRRVTALYIEADAACAALMRQLATASGSIEVHVAPTAAEGLALAQDLGPDVIVMNLDLPDECGTDLKARLASNALTRAIPVVAVSDNPGDADRRLTQGLGFRRHLGLPLRLAEVVEVLHAAGAPSGMARVA